MFKQQQRSFIKHIKTQYELIQSAVMKKHIYIVKATITNFQKLENKSMI